MLGSRKLLIVLCIVPCVLSLVCIGAFAVPAEDVTPSVDLPLDTEVVQDVVKSPSYVAEDTFPASPLLESSYYSYDIAFSQVPYSAGTALSGLSSLALYDPDGKYLFGVSLDNGAAYVSTSEPYTVYYHNSGESEYSSFVIPEPYLVINNYRFSILSGSDTLYGRGGVNISGTLVEESLVPDIADSVFDLGDALITFIMSSWVVMIPLAAWLVILCIGAIRKLVKGV